VQLAFLFHPFIHSMNKIPLILPTTLLLNCENDITIYILIDPFFSQPPPS
jgi:hypothetical protein